MAWYFVLHFNMVAKPGVTPGHSYLNSKDLLGYFIYSGKHLNLDSVPKETWSNLHDDEWVPSQTPVLSVTR